MSIEPSQAYTVQTSRVMPPKPAPVIPQPKLSMAEEAKQVRARFLSTWGPCRTSPSDDDVNALRQQQAIAEREELAQRVLAMLTDAPRTSADLREALDATENRLRAAIRILRDKGQVTKRREGKYSVWAIPGVGQAKPITVRGEVFPSLSACARHFGISVQAVADRIRRGSTDTIVMRKEAAE